MIGKKSAKVKSTTPQFISSTDLNGEPSVPNIVGKKCRFGGASKGDILTVKAVQDGRCTFEEKTYDYKLETVSKWIATYEASDEYWPPINYETSASALPFPIDVFPPLLRLYCEKTAESMITTPDFVGVSMLGVASAAIGQSVNVRVKDRWIETPLLYILLAGTPGKKKTPVAQEVARPLDLINRWLIMQSKEAIKRWEDSDEETRGDKPPFRRIIVKDITREKLADVHQDNPRGLFCFPDEASGWVGGMNEYKGRGADRQFWLSIWSSVPIIVDRKSAPSMHIDHPFITVLSSIQPDMLSCLSDEQGRTDGFLERLLISYPNVYPPTEWTDYIVADDIIRVWELCIAKLANVPMYGTRADIIDFAFDAKDRWIEWFNEHGREMDAAGFDENLDGYWSKLIGHAARFALILSRIRVTCMDDGKPEELQPPVPPSTGCTVQEPARLEDMEFLIPPQDTKSVVTIQDVEGAIKLVTYFKNHLSRTINLMNGGAGSKDAADIIKWIKGKNVSTFTPTNVKDDIRRFYKQEPAFDQAIKQLASIHAIKLQKPNPQINKRGPKLAVEYLVNPSLLS